MKKLFVFLSLLLLFQCTAQRTVTSSTGTISLSGKGKLGGTTDSISVRRYNATLSTPYLYGAFFKAVSTKKAGVGISIRNDSTSSNDGKLQAAHILLRNDSLIVYRRSVYNQTLSKIYGKANVILPTYLTAEANGNKLKIYTSKKSNGTNLTKILDKDSVFLGWKHKTPNLLFPIAKQVSSVELANISLRAAIVDTTGSNAPSNNSGGGNNGGGGNSGGGNSGNSGGSGGSGSIVVDTTTHYYLSSTTNTLKTLAPATSNILNINHFGTITQRTYTDSTGYIRPTWAVYWDLEHRSFTYYNRKPYELGLAAAVYGGEVGPDFTRQGIDYLDANYYTFTSAIPYYNRAHNQYYVTSSDALWNSGTDEQLFDMGNEVGQSNLFGGADNQDNKTLRALVGADIETNDENGSRKHRIFLLAAARKTRGYVSSLYGGIFNEFGLTENQETGAKKMYNYPDSLGNYSETGLGRVSVDWRTSTTTTLETRGLYNAKLTDYNILPCTEQSYYFESFAEQGGIYPLNDRGDYVAVNKFGTNKTVQHPMSLLGTILQWQAYYARYKLNNKRNMFMPKLIADKGNLIGRNEYSKSSTGLLMPDELSSHIAPQIGRKYAFFSTMMCFLNGVDMYLWDRAVKTDGGIDTYAGVFAAVKLLDSTGAVQNYRSYVPEFWETEYSLDGITYQKTKAINWDVSTTSVLPILVTKSANSAVIFAMRPEGVEPLNCVVRLKINNVYRYVHIGANDWETVDYQYRNTSRSALPTSAKHYYYQKINF